MSKYAKGYLAEWSESLCRALCHLVPLSGGIISAFILPGILSYLFLSYHHIFPLEMGTRAFLSCFPILSSFSSRALL